MIRYNYLGEKATGLRFLMSQELGKKIKTHHAKENPRQGNVS
jgi:hypothetical protein